MPKKHTKDDYIDHLFFMKKTCNPAPILYKTYSKQKIKKQKTMKIMDEPNVFAGIVILICILFLVWFGKTWYKSYIISKAIKHIEADHKKQKLNTPEKI